MKLINLLKEIYIEPEQGMQTGRHKKFRSSVVDHIDKILNREMIDQLSNTNSLDYCIESEIYNDDHILDLIRKQMAFAGVELLRNGKEMLVTLNNISDVTDQEVIDYIESNDELLKYLRNLTRDFYLQEVDLDSLRGEIEDHLDPNDPEHDSYYAEHVAYWEVVIDEQLDPETVILEQSVGYVDYVYSHLVKSELFLENKLHIFRHGRKTR